MRERGAAWAENAYRELAARGHRTGGARGAVIERLARAHGCCTAAELTAWMGLSARLEPAVVEATQVLVAEALLQLRGELLVITDRGRSLLGRWASAA